MNGCLKLGSGQRRLNVVLWVRLSLPQVSHYAQLGKHGTVSEEDIAYA